MSYSLGDKKRTSRKVVNKMTKAERLDKATGDSESVKIICKTNEWLRTQIPGSVFAQSPFRWQPLPFATQSDQLHETVIEPEKQLASLALFTKDTTQAMNFIVSSNPDDSAAKYFAAYLCGLHHKQLGARANVVWHNVYESYKNPMLEADEPTLLVLCNVMPEATALKVSKTRDILEHWAHVPKIIVTAGMDPLSFGATKLRVPVHAMAYIPDTIVKHKVEFN